MNRPLDDDTDDDCEPCAFSADDFVAVLDRLLDRCGAMSLPDGMGLREAIAGGFVPAGAVEAAIATEWRS